MKTSIVCITLLIMMATATISNAQKKEAEKKQPQKKSEQKDNTKSVLLRHVVLFKFKDSSSSEDVKKVEGAFRELPKKIKLIKSFEWGTNNSPENLNQGLTHCFLVTFKDEKDRETYLSHPDHQAFVEVLKPHLDKVTVVDYWAYN